MNAAETLGTAEETFQTAEKTLQTVEETFQTAEETWNHLGAALEFYLDKDGHLSWISSPFSLWLETQCCLLGPLNPQFSLLFSSEFCIYQPASSPCLSLPWVAC